MRVYVCVMRVYVYLIALCYAVRGALWFWWCHVDTRFQGHFDTMVSLWH